MTNHILPQSEQVFKSDFDDFPIPDPVLLNMIRTGQIPTVKFKWLDERICCRRARESDPRQATGCTMLAQDSDGGTTWCRLNAPGATPCVFHEPQDAKIWQDIRQQQELALKLYGSKRNGRDFDDQD